MKKFFALALVFLSIFAVAACDGGEEENGDQAHVDEARERLVLSAQLDEVTGDINLPTELGNYPDVEIEWSSSDPEVVATDGTVTRPEPGEGNANVTLTATLTYNDATAERQYALTVMEAADVGEIYSNFETLYGDMDDLSLGEMISVQGYVTSRWSGGVFVYDGENHFGIFDDNNFEIQNEAALGDELRYTGELARYHSLYQVGERDSAEVVETDQSSEYTNPVTDSSIDELTSIDPSDDLTVHGKHFTVEGLLTMKGDNDNLYLESTSSEEEIMIYYFSFTESLEALEAEVGEIVEIEVVYYTNHGQNGLMVVFQGGADDITIIEPDDSADLATDIGNLEDKVSQGDAITLPDSGDKGTTFTNWSSGNTDLIADDGSFVAYPSDPTTVTFTGDATLNEESDTATFEVTMLPENADTVDTARNAAEDDPVFIEGVVTSFPVFSGNSGFFIQDSDGTGIMINKDFNVSIGDKVQIAGNIALQTQYQDGNTLYRVENAQLINNDEGNHDVFVFDNMSANDIATNFADNQSQRYRLENVTVDGVDADNNTVYIETNVGDGDTYRLRYDIRNYGPSIGDTYFEAGDTIEWIEFTVYDMSFDDIRIEYVEGKDFVSLDTSITVD